jgi:hypothetical protein
MKIFKRQMVRGKSVVPLKITLSAFHAGDRGSNPLGDATYKTYFLPMGYIVSDATLFY